MLMLADPRRRLDTVRESRARGFTLLELLTTLALVGILFVLGLPSFRAWISNNQMRTVADSLQNGLRQAQTEAVRLNQQVVLALTNGTPLPAPAALPTAVANGKRWVLANVAQFGAATPTATFIQGGSLTDVASTVLITGPAAICFNSNGRLVANASTGVTGATCAAGPAVYALAQTTPSTDDRQFRILVSLAGQVRMCDLSLPTQSAASPAGCPVGTT